MSRSRRSARRRSALLVAAAVAMLADGARAEKKKLSIEDLTAEPPLAGRTVTGLTWMADGRSFTYVVRRGDGAEAAGELWLENAATGQKRVVLSSVAATATEPPGGTGDRKVPRRASRGPQGPGEAEREVTPGVRPGGVEDRKDPRRASRGPQGPGEAERETPPPRRLSLDRAGWSPDGQSLIVPADGDLWLYRASSRQLERLTEAAGAEEHPSFSPDGKRIAFVRGNDLYVLDVGRRAERRLTRDGSETLFNGKLDWVYEEELAGRDSRAYQWSPDGTRIAYLRLDDASVGRYPISDYLRVPATVEWQLYPKAGTANPDPSFHVVSVDGAALAAEQLSGDGYIVPGFSWTVDSRSVAYRTLNREQNRQELRLCTPGQAASRVLLTEDDPYWINALDPPRFLPDGRFLWRSERTGWAHLYVGTIAGATLRAITSGEWMVERVIGVTPKSGLVYFTATEEDVRRRPIYRVGLDGRGFARLTTERGTHTAELSPDGRHLLATRSSVAEPPVVSLRDADGRLLRVVNQPQSRLAEYDLATTEELELPADDGTRLEARLVKPADFDPSRKYPVIVYVYGGPHSQVVRDNWGATSLLDHLLASRGFLVWSLDNRGSWGRGHAWESALFRSTGKRELADQLAGVRYLKSLPYVDPGRIGIWGWSYGGYMTLFALTNAPDVWKCGLAGAPVTHWKFYDTIYTERYMRTPQDNPDGYEESAPLTRAGDLRAPLLLIHGTNDDNVHMQNTVAFIDALTKAGRPYTLQLQPRQKHGIRGAAAINFRNAAIVRFFDENL